jgi:hypothetical protein
MARSMPHVLPVLFLFALIAPCLANIGENEANVGERYGKSFGEIPTNTFGVITGFIASGYVVGVKFVDGTSEMEMFSKGDQSDMAASEINRLLQKNSTGDWKAEPTGKAHWRRWRRDDGSAVALYDTVRHFLYINSKNFYEIKGQQMEQQEWNFNNGTQATRPGVSSTAIPAITSAPSPSSSP